MNIEWCILFRKTGVVRSESSAHYLHFMGYVTLNRRPLVLADVASRFRPKFVRFLEWGLDRDAFVSMSF